VCNLNDDLDGNVSCSASYLAYPGIMASWKVCLYFKEEGEEWHIKDCLLDEYNSCGVEQLLPICPKELDGDKVVSWKYFDKQITDFNEET
jgi:hypothetical protein